MAIAFVSDAATTFASGGSGTATAPSGTSTGMLVRAIILVYDTTTATPTISGWTVLSTSNFSNATARGTVRHLYRILTGTDSYSVTIGSADYSEVYIAAYSGAHATPFPDTPAFTQGASAGAQTITGVTVSTAGSLLVCDLSYYNLIRTSGPTAPGTWTAREVDFDSGSFSSYESPFSGTGATGNLTGGSTTILGGDTAWAALVSVIKAAGGAANTLTASQASFTLTGNAAGLIHARPKLTATQVSFALTGNAAALKRARPPLVATQVSFALTGQAATLSGPSGHTPLTATQASFALTGQAAGLKAGRKLAVAFGSFSVPLEDANLSRARPPLSATQASFAVTGQAAALTGSGGGHPPLTAAQASFALTGQATALRAARRTAATQVAFTLTGPATGLPAARKLTSAQASFALTGQAATLLPGHGIPATVASFGLVGNAVVLSRSRPPATATQVGFALTGQAAALRRGYVLAAVTKTMSAGTFPAALNASNGSTETSPVASRRGRLRIIRREL